MQGLTKVQHSKLWCTTKSVSHINKILLGHTYAHLFAYCLWHPTPVLLPGKSRGQRSLVGCSPWGRWGSDTTERLPFHFSLSCIGERNGNPLQCSCLENPRDGGAWWAAVYGVAQSRTRLKWLSIYMVAFALQQQSWVAATDFMTHKT